MVKKFIVFFVAFPLLLNFSFAKGNSYLSLVYGYNPLKLQDFDDHISSLNNMLNTIYDTFPLVGQVVKSIGLQGVERANSFGSEMRMEIVNRFEIGILFSYYFTHKTGESSVTSGIYEVRGDMNTKLTILNPNLVLYHYIPFAKWFYAELYAGAGYYYAQVPFNQFLSFYHPELFGQTDYFYQQVVETKLRSHGWGVLGGITFEIRPFSFLGILLGGRYRYVQMGPLSGSGAFEDSNTPRIEIDNGTLYYYLDQELADEFGGEFPMLIFSEDEPTGLTDLRKARLNLTGFTIVVGLRLWF